MGRAEGVLAWETEGQRWEGRGSEDLVPSEKPWVQRRRSGGRREDASLEISHLLLMVMVGGELYLPQL